MEIIILDGAYMTDKEAVHAYLAKQLALPSHYGKNLDALADCLSELAAGTTVVLQNVAVMRKELGRYGDSLIEVFEEISADDRLFDFVLVTG